MKPSETVGISRLVKRVRKFFARQELIELRQLSETHYREPDTKGTLITESAITEQN